MSKRIAPQVEPVVDPRVARRRRLLLGGASWLAVQALAACGGGGGGGAAPPETGAPPPSPSPTGGTAPTGRLVFRNSGVAAIWNFAAGTEVQFDPGVRPSFDPGMTVSRDGTVCAAREGDGRTYFELALFGLDGVYRDSVRVEREFAFQTGAAVFNADSSRLAFSVDEPISATNDQRRGRTLVYAWPSGDLLLSVDGHENPAWARDTGELLMSDEDTQQVRLFDAGLQDQGLLPGLVVSHFNAGWDVSPDGRYVLSEDANTPFAYDRSDGSRWVMAEDSTSDLHAPVLSPDGRWLAVMARDLIVYVPHILPFAPGFKVTVDSKVHALKTGLADCRGRMGWAA